MPEAPLEIVSQAALLVAVQEHAAPAVTETLPVPPAAAEGAVVVPSAYVQIGAAVSGRRMNALNSGPVGGGAVPPIGAATVSPVIGSVMVPPAYVPCKTGAPKKSAAFRTSNACPGESAALTSTETVAFLSQLKTVMFARPGSYAFGRT